jgi:hypothetical protein
LIIKELLSFGVGNAVRLFLNCRIAKTRIKKPTHVLTKAAHLSKLRRVKDSKKSSKKSPNRRNWIPTST